MTLRPLVKKFGTRWCVLRPVAPRQFEHISSHDTWQQALDAAGWFVWWQHHDGALLDQVGAYHVRQFHRAAWWVARHWGTQ